jgi:DNA-binding CsgD family transcriptional regulator
MSPFAAATLALPPGHATAIRLPGRPAEANRELKPLSGFAPPSTSLTDFELLSLGLDQAGTPLMILAADGAIRHLNPAAEEMLRHSPIFQLRHNKLHTRRNEEAAAIRQSIHRMGSLATPGADAVSAIVNLHGREGCVVTSMLMRSLTPRGLTGAIILRVADFISRPTSDPIWIANIFGLTPAESKVANGLLEGLNIAAIAVREGNAVETVRGHVKRAMAKVSVRPQAQFVSMLMRAHAALVNPDVGSRIGAQAF